MFVNSIDYFTFRCDFFLFISAAYAYLDIFLRAFGTCYTHVLHSDLL